MVSHKDIVAPAKDLLLIPFYLTVVIFLIVFQPFLELPEESILAAVSKALPLLCLAAFVYKKHLHPNGTDDPYVPCVLLALLLSSFGDVCMLFRSTLLHLGVILFTVAHFMYIVGLNGKQDVGHRKSVYLFVNLLVVMFLAFHESLETMFDKISMVLYFSVLMAVGAMAACRYEKEESLPALWGVVGAALFITSDSLIVIDTFALQGVSTEFIVMILYYGAQLSFALSTIPVVSSEENVIKEK